MQRLQQLLQKAIKEKAALLEISVGQAANAWLLEGNSFWHELGIFSDADVSSLFKLLFPKGTTDRPVQGQIDVPGFGVLMTLGTTSPRKKLTIFLPAGHDLFEQAWNDAHEPAAIVAPSVPDLPPPPQPPIPKTSMQRPLPDATNQIINQAVPPLDLPTNIFHNPGDTGIKTSATSQTGPAEMKIDRTATPPPFIPDLPLDPNGITLAPLQGNFPSQPPGLVAAAAPLSDQILELDNVSALPVQSLTSAQEFPSRDTGSVHFATEPSHARHQFHHQHSPVKQDLGTDIEEGPKELDVFLRLMLERRASDIHITSGEPLAMRIDGEITRLPDQVWNESNVARMLDPITSPYHRHQFDSDNDVDFAYEMKGIARFRVNLFRDRHGRGAVIRHIPNNIPTFEQLGLPEVLKKLCLLNKGLVVVTGPTGSGKSTTLAAMVDFINANRKDHILTLEDPIEFVHSQKGCLIRQREIHRHTKSFARALKAALREDPDIIMVGELRDLETTALAIEIAETGHLVLGTLHTTTAISTIDRVIDQFSTDRQEQIRTMLAESLKGVVSQTLLKKASGGRIAAQEVLIVNPAVSALIRESKVHMIPSHMQSQKADGNLLLNEALTNLVIKKIVHPKDAFLKAIDKTNLVERMRMAGVDLSWLGSIGAA